MTLTEYAAKHGKTEHQARRMLAQGRIPGATPVVKPGSIQAVWSIPEGTPWPELRKPGSKPKGTSK